MGTKKNYGRALSSPSPARPAVLKEDGIDPKLGITPASVPYDVFVNQPSEIVIGLVGPLGTDNEKMRRLIGERLAAYGYSTEIIRISTLIIPALGGFDRIPDNTKYNRAKALIELGNQIRKQSKNNAVLAVTVAAEICRRRPPGQVQRIAYLVNSLKLPEEVAELRKIYGKGFFLFAVHSDRDLRVENLSSGGKGMSQSEALELILRDEHETVKYGQHTRDTFQLADFFLADERNDDKLKNSIERCFDLLFGNPVITPTFNEYAMFMAFAASVRSADLARQVGAVVSKGNEIVSTGANDCPAPGGGLYWPAFNGDRIDDVPRGRDYKRGADSNTVQKLKLIAEIVDKFSPNEREQAEIILKESKINDITEYGRVVHAEMEALLACARSNVSSVGTTLYCTTFPCHNCAKHIIAAGVEQVIYVEPYPKSKALEFHDDAATIGKLDGEKKVRFKPFIGVGPKLFFELFSLSMSSGREIKRKSRDGSVVIWKSNEALPRIPMIPLSHRDFELMAVKYIKGLKGD